MRSKLFVPGSRPELFEKALNSSADALSFDLEDAVTEDKKNDARLFVKNFLNQIKNTDKKMIVRTNHVSSEHFKRDVQEVTSSGLSILNIPKVESSDEIKEAVRTLEIYEKEYEIKKKIKILVNIESPKGLRIAADLAKSSDRVTGLQIGYGDLFSPLDISRDNKSAIEKVMFTVRMAAGEANIYAIDGAYTNVSNTKGYEEEATLARNFGFIGKSCVHPNQIEMANNIFRPSDEDIFYSLKVLNSLKDEDKQSVGAFIVDGKMVDAPLFEKAKKIVAHATKLGLLNTQ